MLLNAKFMNGGCIIYSGIREISFSQEQLAAFYQDIKVKNACEDYKLLPNEYLIVKNDEGKVVDKYRFDGTSLVEVKVSKTRYKSTMLLKPLDARQECAYDLLFNKHITIKCLVGKSGVGKTKLSLMAGLEMVRQGEFDKVFLIRHNVEAGESLGLLKGTKEDKMFSGWSGCFIDNLPNGRIEFEELYRTNRIEMDVLAFLKGRDIKHSVIILDEAEDLTVHQMKLVGTRVSQGSVFIVAGDYLQTSKDKFRQDSGLLRLLDTAKGKSYFGVIELSTNGRNEVSEFFTSEY